MNPRDVLSRERVHQRFTPHAPKFLDDLLGAIPAHDAGALQFQAEHPDANPMLGEDRISPQPQGSQIFQPPVRSGREFRIISGFDEVALQLIEPLKCRAIRCAIGRRTVVVLGDATVPRVRPSRSRAPF